MAQYLLPCSCPNHSVALNLSFLFITTSNCLSRKGHFFNLGGRDIILVVGACQNNSQYRRWHLSVTSFSRNIFVYYHFSRRFFVSSFRWNVFVSSRTLVFSFRWQFCFSSFSRNFFASILCDSFLSTVLRELFPLHFLVELFYFQKLGDYFLLPIFRGNLFQFYIIPRKNPESISVPTLVKFENMIPFNAVQRSTREIVNGFLILITKLYLFVRTTFRVFIIFFHIHRLGWFHFLTSIFSTLFTIVLACLVFTDVWLHKPDREFQVFTFTDGC